MINSPNLEFRKIEVDFDWYNRIPLEIAIAFRNQYYYNADNEFVEEQRFLEVVFSDFSTIVRERAYLEFRSAMELRQYHIEDGTSFGLGHLKEYFLAYHEGFLKGYSELVNVIGDSTSIYNDSTIISKRVFDIVAPELSRFQGFSFIKLKADLSKKVVTKDLLYKDGMGVGQLYKAWYFIIENPEQFISLFRSNSKAIEFYRSALFFSNQNEHSWFAGSLEGLVGEMDNNKGSIESNDLSAFEIALKHWYLVRAKELPYIVPAQVGKLYGHLKNNKNIEHHYGEIDSKEPKRKVKLSELEKIHKELSEYPAAFKAVENEIDQLR